MNSGKIDNSQANYHNLVIFTHFVLDTTCITMDMAVYMWLDHVDMCYLMPHVYSSVHVVRPCRHALLDATCVQQGTCG